MSVPHIGTQQWIDSLNLTLADTWRAWYTEGQVAGYVLGIMLITLNHFRKREDNWKTKLSLLILTELRSMICTQNPNPVSLYF